ncbi:phosphoglycerate mutase family protein, partial [Priestia megaterium]
IGWSDLPLCKEGKYELKEHFLEPKLVISSYLKRALETSTVVFTKSQVDKSKNWREMHIGDWKEKTYEELKNIRAKCKWIDH